MKMHRVNALMLKYWYISKNRLDRLFDVFYWPMLDILLWGFATYYIKDLADVNLLSMFMGGVILWVFVWRASQDITVFVLEDFWSRNLFNLFTSPVRTSELVASTVIFALGRSIITFFFLWLMAFLLYQFSILTIGIYLVVFIPLLLLFGWALGLLISALIFRFGQRIQVFAWSAVWLLQPFSCIFYPLSALPGWARGFASVLPSTRIFESMRAILAGNPVDIGSIWYAFSVTIVLLIAATFLMHKAVEGAKKRGMLTHNE
ncbi:MAG: ABC transporter permease [archaeon]